MNDSGVAAFAVSGAGSNGGGTAIVTGDGASIETVIDICIDSSFAAVLRPTINNAGAVAFMADADGTSGYDSVFRIGDGTITLIAGPGSATSSVATLTAALEPAINNQGVATFTGQGVSAYGIFTGAGSALTTISVDNPSTFNGINDDSWVAFVGKNNTAIQTGNGRELKTIAEVSATGFQAVHVGGGAAINNIGRVAFLAVTQSGDFGVFTGSEPDTDVVLKTGDGDVFPVIPGFGRVTNL
jgi:hypothetical protein